MRAFDALGLARRNQIAADNSRQSIGSSRRIGMEASRRNRTGRRRAGEGDECARGASCPEGEGRRKICHAERPPPPLDCSDPSRSGPVGAKLIRSSCEAAGIARRTLEKTPMAADVAETLTILSDPTSAAPGAVAADIDRWKAELQGLGPSGQSIIADLDALKAAFSSGGGDVGPILVKLGRATTAAASGDIDLQTLGAQLSSFGR